MGQAALVVGLGLWNTWGGDCRAGAQPSAPSTASKLGSDPRPLHWGRMPPAGTAHIGALQGMEVVQHTL